MADQDQSTVQLSDGSQLSVDWVYPDAPQYEWTLEREHWPEPMTPIDRWIWINAWPGADRAWAEIDMEPPIMFARFQTVGPYLYVRTTMPPPEKMAAMVPRIMAVMKEYGNALGLWKTYCEPRIIKACADLDAMDGSGDIRVAAETLFYGFHQTFTGLGLMFIPNMQLGGMLTQHNVDDAELTGFELTQGGDNATQDIDAEVWELAGLARGTPVVARIITDGGDDAIEALRREPDASTFVDAFDALIERHGRRSQGWMLLSETWAERPDAALALVRAQLGAEAVSPDELRERTAQRRQAATERALAAIPADKHEEFLGVVQQLEGYVSIREGRAYWQLVISGAMRNFLHRVGQRLVDAGRIDRAGDVFFLTPDEITGSDADMRSTVETARAYWERHRQITPPRTIGTPGDVAAKMAAADPEELRGSAASRGSVTATVRILRSPEEGAKLKQGDILVTAMTTPAWSPLFAIAGGIITETGGALSHPAITAREYGIPAVVALEGATTRLQDGQTVTLDGTAGTVTPQ